MSKAIPGEHIITKLKPNQDGYFLWAEQTLDVIRAKHGPFANYLRNKAIKVGDITVPAAPVDQEDRAAYALWEADMKAIVAYKKKVMETSPNVIGLIQSLLSEESKSKLRDMADH
jgi:hypothetical protein